jgi:hypothetical protein
MAGSAERSQMLFGVGRIVVAAGGEACGRFPLIHPKPAVALVMKMKPVLSGRPNPQSFRVITRPSALSVKVTDPKGPPIPLAQIELIVAVAVAAPALHVPTGRRPTTKNSASRLSLGEIAGWHLLFPFG